MESTLYLEIHQNFNLLNLPTIKYTKSQIKLDSVLEKDFQEKETWKLESIIFFFILFQMPEMIVTLLVNFRSLGKGITVES